MEFKSLKFWLLLFPVCFGVMQSIKSSELASVPLQDEQNLDANICVNECSICLQTIQGDDWVRCVHKDEAVRMDVNQQHWFCKSCFLEEWLLNEQKIQCPLCRTVVDLEYFAALFAKDRYEKLITIITPEEARNFNVSRADSLRNLITKIVTIFKQRVDSACFDNSKFEDFLLFMNNKLFFVEKIEEKLVVDEYAISMCRTAACYLSEIRKKRLNQYLMLLPNNNLLNANSI